MNRTVVRSPVFNLPRGVVVEAIAPADSKLLEEYVQDIGVNVAQKGKFTKFEAGYSPVPLVPPIYWDYRCERCRVFAAPSSCGWVKGVIKQDGTCSLWIPPAKFERPFSWVTRVREAPSIVLRSIRNLFALASGKDT